MDLNPSRPGADSEHGGGGPPRRGALWIAGLGVTLVAGAAFVLSYEGLYAAALAGGVRPSLAFLYPMIFDGFLLLAFVAAVVLRSVGLRATWYPWILIVVLLSAAAGANVLHAVGRAMLLPPDSMRVAVAAVPPAALGLAFPLWLLMFAYLRGGRRTGSAGVAGPATGDVVPGLRGDDADEARTRRPAETPHPDTGPAHREQPETEPAGRTEPAEPAGRTEPAEPAGPARPARPVTPAGQQGTEPADPDEAVEPEEAATATRTTDSGETEDDATDDEADPTAPERPRLTGRPAMPPPITPPSSKVRSSPIPPDA